MPRFGASGMKMLFLRFFLRQLDSASQFQIMAVVIRALDHQLNACRHIALSNVVRRKLHLHRKRYSS